MPFKSEKQRRYLFANEPELAKKWSNMYGDKIIGLGGVKPKRTKKNINLIYKYTLRDYRSFPIDGQKSILYYDEKFGTILSPIISLPGSLKLFI